MSERQSWVVWGRKIGTGTGWDQADTFVMQLYDFEGGEGYTGPCGPCVIFDFERGRIETVGGDGKLTGWGGLISGISGPPGESHLKQGGLGRCLFDFQNPDAAETELMN